MESYHENYPILAKVPQFGYIDEPSGPTFVFRYRLSFIDASNTTPLAFS